MNEKIVLITGASSGIGKDAAKTLITKGYIVYAAARRLEQMADLKEMGGIPVKMDITKEEDIIALVERIQKDHGGVDILINNAGYATQGPVEEVSIEDVRRMYDVNLFGLARLTQLVIPHMRERKAGKIINITSVAGKVYFALGSWYVSTKHALEGWSDCLRMELKPFNIDVVIVEPGAISTEFNDVSVDPLLDKHGHGPYKEMVQSFVKFSRKNDSKEGNSSPPSVITRVIVKAIQSARPKTRYVAGAMAKPIILLRKWGGDCLYDMVLSRLIR